MQCNLYNVHEVDNNFDTANCLDERTRFFAISLNARVGFCIAIAIDGL